MTLTLPIYWTKEFKTKPNKTHLMGMNWFRSAYYHDKNKAKKHFHSLVEDQCWEAKRFTKFKVHYKLYYKNKVCDASNVIALIEKFALDGLKEAGVIIDDSIKYHVGSSWEVIEQDKVNPRVELSIEEVVDDVTETLQKD